MRGPLVALLAALIATTAAFWGFQRAAAQIPDEFKNLKVLPKNTSKRELVSTMREFSTSLGVRCNYCHVGKDPNSLEGYDFASDEKEKKKIARVMMRMVNDINEKQIPQTGIKSPVRVSCITCHRGVEEPETLDMLLMGVIEKDGVAAAQTRYRELREKYYGKGSYDFSSSTLNNVAEQLGQGKRDFDGAIAMVKLGLEFEPREARSHALLGQLYASKGDKDAAVKSYEKALEIDPENRFFKQQLEKARSQN